MHEDGSVLSGHRGHGQQRGDIPDAAARAAKLSLIVAGVVAAGIIFLTLADPPRTQAQTDGVQVAGSSLQTRQRLRELEQQLARPTTETVEGLIHILEEEGNTLISWDGRRYIAARRAAQMLLGRLPPELLEGYRTRIDPPAERLRQAAQQRGQTRLLQELVERYPLSRAAADTLREWGDRLFESGEPQAALYLWQHLQPGADAEWHHPDAATDPATVEARIILARIVLGELESARAAMQEFRQRHPHLQGCLAGQQGRWCDLLEQWLRRPPTLPRPALDGRVWSTYAGNAARNPVIVAESSEWGTRPAWQLERTAARGEPMPRQSNGLLPPCYPVCGDGAVYCTDGRELFAYELRTGRRWGRVEVLPSPLPAGQGGVAGVTLAWHDGWVYLRVGQPPVQSTLDDRKGPTTWLVGVQVQPSGGSLSMVVRWHLSPPAGGYWLGAPLVVHRRLWAAYARLEGGRLHYGIACYDPSDAATTPPLSWSTEVAEQSAPATPPGRHREELLTWAHDRIYFNTNAGVVAAVDARSGQRLWAYRYPSDPRRAAGIVRPSPAVYADGHVYAAPADGDGIFAWEAESGRLVWELRGRGGAMVHAVTATHVLCSQRQPLPAVLGIGCRSGSSRWDGGGWFVTAGSGLTESGSPLVVGDRLVWPGRSGFMLMRCDSGLPVFEPLRLAPWTGHLMLSDGVLLAVSPERLAAFVPPRPLAQPEPGSPP